MASSDAGTPQRRSVYELQNLVNELFAEHVSNTRNGTDEQDNVDETDSQTCRCSDLPTLLEAFELRKNITLLNSEEKAQLQDFVNMHPDLDIKADQFISVLVAMTVQSANSGSPTPRSSSSLSTSSMNVGRRGRSSSSSSVSSFASRKSTTLIGTGLLENTDSDAHMPRSQSMPVHLPSPPFTPSKVGQPSTHQVGASLDGKPLPARPLPGNSLTLQHTPVASSILARQRSSPLDTTGEAFRRIRPAPPKSRRISGEKFYNDSPRGRTPSEEMSPKATSPLDLASPLAFQPMDVMHETDVPDQYAQYRPQNSRNNSNLSSRAFSPVFGISSSNLADAPLFSPTSPSIEQRSFHPAPASPVFQTHDYPSAHDYDTMHTRPGSISSLASEAALSEMIQQLQQELARKTQDLEAQRADGYAAIMEKEALLEEIRTELAAKRREEKELRSKEKLNLNQIANLEAQTASFRDERDKQRAAYQNTRRQYEDQCNESEKLRNAIREKDEELRLADEALQNSTSDVVKMTRERDYLQAKAARLEAEINEVHQAVEDLEEQRHENLALRETIDRLRLDLDELRTQARLSASASGGAGLSRSASGSDGAPGTIGRNLGRELAKRLKEGGSQDALTVLDEAAKAETGSDGYEEEIITTRRKLKRPSQKVTQVTTQAANVHNALQTPLEDSETVDIGVQIDLKMDQADAMTCTDPEIVLSVAAKRDQLARELAVDLDAVDAYIRAKEEQARLRSSVPDAAPPPYQHPTNGLPSRFHQLPPFISASLPSDARIAVELALRSSGTLLACGLLIYFSGVVTGAWMFPVRHYHHTVSFDTYATWAASNSLDGLPIAHAGWRDNLLFWFHRLVWRSVAVGRRVPT